jgi:hypothetical protein
MKAKPFDPYHGIPKSLKIGNFRFSVSVQESGDSQAMMAFGHMNPISQSIRLAPDQNAQNLADTFIHEVLHAIHWHFELMGENVDEEDFTTRTAHGLCQLWQDNPAAMAWWVGINKQAA